MPAKPPFPLSEATTIVTDMLGALSSPESPGFSRYSVSPTTRLVSAQRLDRHGKEAGEEEVQRGSFNARVVFRLKAEEAMLNQVGSMHGGCVATIIDVLTSLAIVLHLPDQEPTTPWAFLGVTSSLSVVYLSAVPLDGWVEVDCNVVSIGKRIAVISADLWLVDGEEGEGDRIRRTASGTHTKVDNSFASKM